jgi:hypothetical protein
MDNPYSVGDSVLASRTEGDETQEEAKVIDAYTLLIGEEERPMVCVQFPDGERVYLRSNGPDIRPVEEPEEETAPGDEPPAG